MFSKIIRRSVVSAVLKESFTAEGSAIKAAGTWKDERQIISKQGSIYLEFQILNISKVLQ